MCCSASGPYVNGLNEHYVYWKLFFSCMCDCDHTEGDHVPGAEAPAVAGAVVPVVVAVVVATATMIVVVITATVAAGGLGQTARRRRLSSESECFRTQTFMRV